MPLPERWLTSLLLRCNGHSLLIDCGEGTQIALREQRLGFKDIDTICFTHYHADHISGLPGLMLTIGNCERTEPLLLVGPRGLERTVRRFLTVAPELPFPLEFLELEEGVQSFRRGELHITAFPVEHSMPCRGYTVELPRAGRFDPVRARAAGIPVALWSRLQKGETITQDGVTYTPDQVLGPARRGLKLVYTTDTRPVPEIARQAADADLLICEGMYGEPEKAEKAAAKKHMTFQEAARLAEKAQPEALWLTHFSPALTRPEEYLPLARSIFPATELGEDGKRITLRFKEERKSE
jgi:ribonuclease Z